MTIPIEVPGGQNPTIIPDPDHPDWQANLGLATTEELFREIIARFLIGDVVLGSHKAVVLAEMLGNLGAVEKEYRTVDR